MRQPRTCTRCQLEKPKKDFGPCNLAKDGMSSWCRACKRDYQNAYARARRSMEGYKEKRKASSRVNRLGWYGLMETDYAEILAIQGGGCGGCGRPPSPTRNLDVDHEHQPGDKKLERWERAHKVRGLLCHLCNRALGILRDDPAILRRLADYLETRPAASVMAPKFRRLTAYLEEYEARKPGAKVALAA